MPMVIAQGGLIATCPHGGQVLAASTSGRVLVNGLPALTTSDAYPITGCTFTISMTPSPCVAAQWFSGSGRVNVMGQPILLDSAVGVCLNAEQASQGAPVIISAQTRVSAQ